MNEPTPMRPAVDLETALWGPVLPDRVCGDCTVCCTTLQVDTPELKKPAETPCVHLGGGGCGIHAVRPSICRTWFCAWRRLAIMAEDMRPDRSGLLVFVSFAREPKNCFERVAITVRLLPGSTAIADGTAGRVLDSVCDQLTPVWFSDGATKLLMHPADDVARHVLEGTPAPPLLREEVAAWRERYLPASSAAT
jgi:Fe-S-cluster containining protein